MELDMPLFLDIRKHVRGLTEKTGEVFCLVEAPSNEAANAAFDPW